jgi:hypothetical protein|tara:strand:- start:15750 stop:16088 length:339 start_codon:yes stop_codon:yes gene_type:complete
MAIKRTREEWATYWQHRSKQRKDKLLERTQKVRELLMHLPYVEVSPWKQPEGTPRIPRTSTFKVGVEPKVIISLGRPYDNEVGNIFYVRQRGNPKLNSEFTFKELSDYVQTL